MRILTLLLFLPLLAAAQQVANPLTPEQIAQEEQNLRQALAGPSEEALLQILTEVRILQDDLIDTTDVYDLIVRFDPERYRNPRVGIYPMSFEDQFIFWGKRVSLYTRSTSWASSRFYLNDISTARESWAFTEDMRALYTPDSKRLPAVDPASFPLWLKLLHAIDPYTDLRTMSRWIRLMQDETRDQVHRRLQSERQQPYTNPSP